MPHSIMCQVVFLKNKTRGRFCCLLLGADSPWDLRVFPIPGPPGQSIGQRVPIRSHFFAVPSPMFMAFGRSPLSSTVRMLPALVLLIVFGFETLAANAIFKRSMQFFYRMREKASRAGRSFYNHNGHTVRSTYRK